MCSFVRSFNTFLSINDKSSEFVSIRPFAINRMPYFNWKCVDNTLEGSAQFNGFVESNILFEVLKLKLCFYFLKLIYKYSPYFHLQVWVSFSSTFNGQYMNDLISLITASACFDGCKGFAACRCGFTHLPLITCRSYTAKYCPMNSASNLPPTLPQGFANTTRGEIKPVKSPLTANCWCNFRSEYETCTVIGLRCRFGTTHFTDKRRQSWIDINNRWRALWDKLHFRYCLLHLTLRK